MINTEIVLFILERWDLFARLGSHSRTAKTVQSVRRIESFIYTPMLCVREVAAGQKPILELAFPPSFSGVRTRLGVPD